MLYYLKQDGFFGLFRGFNKLYCIYIEQIGLDRNIADVVDNAMKTKKPILVANDNFGIGIKVVSKNCK